MARVLYQFAVVNACNVDPGVDRLVSTLTQRVQDLGLDPRQDIVILKDDDCRAINPRLPAAAVFFGALGFDSRHTAIVEHLASLGVAVLPVVDSTDDYLKKVPTVLHSINAATIDGDEEFRSISNRLLEANRLMRATRSVFISYKRSDSRPLALQLYASFDERSFDVFLDTHSVERGIQFQPMLWDRLGDADVLILLDTPNAFSSTWVEQEISRAHALGLAILQVVWPNHERSTGSILCEVEYLDRVDFVDPASLTELKPEKARHLVFRAEEIRARSQAARRNRLVGELCRAAAECDHSVTAKISGEVVLRKPGKEDAIIFPIIGHPDSHRIHDLHNHCGGLPARKDAFDCALFDPLGLLEAKARHVDWLNKYLPLRACGVREVHQWMQTRA